MHHSKEGIELCSLNEKDLFRHLGSSENGLTEEEALERIKKYGLNEIKEEEKRYASIIFLNQFKNPLVIVLIFAAFIAYFLGEHIDAIVIFGIIIVNAFLGFYQEYRAEKAVEKLKSFITSKCRVLRDGVITEIDTKHLVPGDIVYLRIGDIVPADIRLIKSEELSADESPLTGESVPVEKKVGIVESKYASVNEMFNTVFMGTHIVSGSGSGIVIATGENTFFGKTAAYLKKKSPDGEFQRSIKKFTNMLLKVIIIMTVFVFVVNAFLGKGVFPSFLFAVAIAVGITPEMLPIIITIAMSHGALRMAKQKVITKNLVSVEDFGNIDTLCCDKTGTLTEGNFTLVDYVNLSGKKDKELVIFGLVCNTFHGKRTKTFENAMDKAIWESKTGRELSRFVSEYKVIGQNELDFTRRRMSVLVRNKNKNYLIVKGAPESVLKVSTYADFNGNKRKISKAIKEKIESQIASFENQGYRVIAVAQRTLSRNKTNHKDERELTLKGFLLFLDPPKKSAKEALNDFKALGINIKILTGDSAVVTRKVCEELDFHILHNRIVTGDELEKLSEKEFEEIINKYNVFARVTPEQKYKIVSVLNREGHIVGFLGDGINDAPALKAADVGISVDHASGIAKEAADIILLKKSLQVLVDGIKEGRKTFGNVTKYILNTISANWGNMFTMSISSLFLRFIPLLPPQILLNNFMSDLPLATVSTDNVDEQFLRKPKRWNIKMITRFMIVFGAISSFFDLLLIFSLLYLIKADIPLFRTAWFVESLLSEIIIVFAVRTHLPFYKSKPSRWLLSTSIIVGFAALLFTFSKLGEKLFQFVEMPLEVLLLITGVLILYFLTAEVAKRIYFKRYED